MELDVTSSTTKVFSFPIKSPKKAVVATDMGAMEQLQAMGDVSGLLV